jgi:preprotein translocase subunit SecD
MLILIAALLLAVLGVALHGLSYGIDFKGGTSFQVKLVKPVESPEQMQQIVSILAQRVDWTGLNDTTVTSIGNDLLLVDIGENNPAVISQLESLLLKQGKFEATLDGEVLFTGSDFVHISRDPAQGFGIGPSTGGGYQWLLPFTLKNDAAKRFTQKTFHQCEIIGADETGNREYDCKKTYFFLDRAENAVVVLSAEQYATDREQLLVGDQTKDIPKDTLIADLLSNAQTELVQFDGNSLSSDQNALSALSALKATRSTALVGEGLDDASKSALISLGYTVKTVSHDASTPLTWAAVGARQVISLSPDVTNQQPFVEDVNQAKVYSQLIIRGYGSTQDDALSSLNSLAVLLESGSLPIPVQSLSKETISPLLGQEFLSQAAWMAIAALIIVAFIIFLKYRKPVLVLPIMATAVMEAFLVLGIAAWAGWKLDLAYVAGIIAAIGTGVNDQIIITDELLHKNEEDEVIANPTERIKRAFFVVIASASTSLVTMVPIIFFSVGLGKLVGFAITTIVGVLVGVFFTRPAYGELAKYLLVDKKK